MTASGQREHRDKSLLMHCQIAQEEQIQLKGVKVIKYVTSQ